MLNRTHLAAFVAALLIAAPATAVAQTPTVPQDGTGLSSEPPDGLGGGSTDEGNGSSGSGQGSTDNGAGGSGSSDSGSGSGSSSSSNSGSGDEKDSSELPRTGEDIAIVLFTGLSLVLVGAGLRLRTADADDF